MKQYIDKSSLVAEIEKRIKGLKDCHADMVAGYAGEISGLERLLSFIDTLEVKEVDFEKLLEDYGIDNNPFSTQVVSSNGAKIIAKHFFELGFKAQIMTSKLQQRISVLKMNFWTGLQTFEETEMTLSDAYNQGIDDILEELGLKAQKGEKV